MAHQQNLLKYLLNLIGMRADEVGDSGEVGDAVAGQGLEDDVCLTAPLDLAAGGDAFGVSKQNNLQQNSWIICGSAHIVVSVVGVVDRQIQLVLYQVMNSVFKCARLKLFLVVDHYHGRLVVIIVLELWHRCIRAREMAHCSRTYGI